MKYNVSVEFGKNLRAERVRQGLSLAELGEKIHLNSSHIAKIERAELSPTLPTIVTLLQGLDLKFEDLIRLKK